MAEGFAQDWLKKNSHKDWLAVSAGTFASNGIPTSSGTVDALSQRGIDFSGTSTPITEKMVHAAHVVFCMSTTHLDIARKLVDDDSTIELLDPEGSIPDPAGLDQVVYDALADRIEQLVAQRLGIIFKKARND